MKYTLHKAGTRGHANHGWLNTFHTFSFADYYNADRVNFGVLRVINDDTILGHNGFGTHPHKNMEIITFPLSGAVAHEDSMGNKGTIEYGEIQVMSAGTGVYHSEFNANQDQDLKLLQIWVLTGKQNVEPRYSQFNYLPHLKHNEFLQIVSPNTDDFGAWIYQNGYVNYGEFDANQEVDYSTKIVQNGLYLFVIDGNITVNGVDLQSRDGIGFEELESLKITTQTAAKLLLFDISMKA